MKSTLFLFDIDGTILDSKGAGKEAFISAFKEVNNISIKSEINFLGGIDNIIFKNKYDELNLPSEQLENRWNNFIKTYSKILSASKSAINWTIFDNVDNIIKYLAENSNIALVTGNIKNGAFIKLEKVNLDMFFQCGGFGDKAVSRKQLVNEAIKNAKSFFKKDFKNDNIYLFGDTLIDVESAFDNNITPILIDYHERYKDKYNELNAVYFKDFTSIKEYLKSILRN